MRRVFSSSIPVALLGKTAFCSGFPPCFWPVSTFRTLKLFKVENCLSVRFCSSFIPFLLVSAHSCSTYGDYIGVRDSPEQGE